MTLKSGKHISEAHEKDIPKLNKGLKCHICETSFAYEQSLSLHRCKSNNKIEKETTEKPFKCEICNTGFMLKTSFDVHNALIHEKKDFGCLTCNFNFDSEKDLQVHVDEVHERKKPEEKSISLEKNQIPPDIVSEANNENKEVISSNNSEPILKIIDTNRIKKRENYANLETSPLIDNDSKITENSNLQTLGKNNENSLQPIIDSPNPVDIIAGILSCDVCDMEFCSQNSLNVHNSTTHGQHNQIIREEKKSVLKPLFHSYKENDKEILSNNSSKTKEKTLSHFLLVHAENNSKNTPEYSKGDALTIAEYGGVIWKLYSLTLNCN